MPYRSDRSKASRNLFHRRVRGIMASTLAAARPVTLTSSRPHATCPTGKLEEYDKPEQVALCNWQNGLNIGRCSPCHPDRSTASRYLSHRQGITASTLAAARPVTLTVHGLTLLVPQANDKPEQVALCNWQNGLNNGRCSPCHPDRSTASHYLSHRQVRGITASTLAAARPVTLTAPRPHATCPTGKRNVNELTDDKPEQVSLCNWQNGLNIGRCSPCHPDRSTASRYLSHRQNGLNIGRCSPCHPDRSTASRYLSHRQGM
ncbi:hypothetical protein J6590_062673 [Homalodisca vitripennis]|nr:hypothetical protein J6590_062673 [Homalodisca vitripennis]